MPTQCWTIKEIAEILIFSFFLTGGSYETEKVVCWQEG